MLSTIRQASCRALPRLIPRHARPITTEWSSKDQSKREAMQALEAEARPSLALSPKPAPLDLDAMHHHIPPAQSPLLQFISTMVMRHGKYAQAAKVTSEMLLHIHALTRSPPVAIVEEAILLVSPAVRCRKMKKGGGKTTLLPMALSERQRARLGIFWIIRETKKPGKAGKTLGERLAREMIAVLNGTSPVLELKSDLHKVAMVNRGGLPTRRY